MYFDATQFTIEGIFGLTGSGKTTYAVYRAFEIAGRFNIPVYSNIRLCDHALRHYMIRRHGHHWRPVPPLHRLFHYLEEEQVAEFWKHVPTYENSIRGCIIILDEAHNWWPQTQQRGNENPHLVSYITQHRKLKHRIWYMTQFDTLVSHTFRKVTHVHWEVRNLRQQALELGAFRLRFPFDGFIYRGTYRDSKGPLVETASIYAAHPAYRWIWKLFDTGGLHAGMDKVISNEISKGDAEMPKRHEQFNSTRWLFQFIWKHKAVCLLGLFCWWLATRANTPAQEHQPKPLPDYATKARSTSDPRTNNTEPTQRTVKAIGSKFVILEDEGLINVGQKGEDYVLVSIEDGSARFSTPDGWRVLRPGGMLPRPQPQQRDTGGSQQSGGSVAPERPDTTPTPDHARANDRLERSTPTHSTPERSDD